MDGILYLVNSGFFRFVAQEAGALCTPKSGDFFGLPTWYKYLDGRWVKSYDPVSNANEWLCSPTLNGVGDVWLVVLAVIDIILRVIGMAAVAWIIWGGLQYLTSQGEPDRTKRAKDTVLNAVIGLVIAMLAVVIVGFLGRQF